MAELAIAMAVVGAVTTIAGSAQAANAQMRAGDQAAIAGQYEQSAFNARKAAADYEALQLEARAGEERAVSQRAAAEERRQARLVQSRLQARAAASGAGADDPTVMDLDAQLEGEGEYRALTAIYGGESRARNLETGAELRRYESGELARAGEFAAWRGRNAQVASRTRAASTFMSGLGTLATSAGGMGVKYATRRTGLSEDQDYDLGGYNEAYF